jgi:hypothetical protein
MITLAVSPAVVPAKADTDWGIVIAGAGIGAAAGAIAFDGPGALVGAGIGAFCTWFGQAFGGGMDQAAFDATSQATLANNSMNTYNEYFSIAHAEAQTLSNHYTALTYYFARQAENGALKLYQYQTLHGQSHVYNASYVITNSEVAAATQVDVWGVQAVYNTLWLGLVSESQAYTGTYNGMSWSVGHANVGGATNGITSSYSSNPYLLVKLMTMTPTCSPGQYIFMPNEQLVRFVNLGSTESGAITIKDTSGATLYTASPTLESGATIDLNLTNILPSSGRYSVIMPGSVEMLGHAVADFVTGPIPLPVETVWVKSNENAVLLMLVLSPTNPNSGPQIIIGSDVTTVYDAVHPNFLRFSTQAGIHYDIDISSQLTDCQDIMTRTTAMLSTANSFGQAYYNALVQTGGSGQAPPPDIIFPDPSQLANLTWEQIYMIYTAYLNGLNGWFHNYTSLSPSDLNISISSFDLYCRGSITNSTGSTLYNLTTIFTPFISLNNMTLHLGNNTFTNPGFIIVWGHAADLFGNWTRIAPVYIPIGLNWKVHIEQMAYQGHAVTSANLTVTNLKVYLPAIPEEIKGPQGITDLTWLLEHWYLLAIVFGVVVLLGGLLVRWWPILLIGGIMVVVGVIGWYLVGNPISLFGFTLSLGQIPPWR